MTDRVPTDYDRLERGLEIDEDDLDRAVMRQPQLFYEVARMVKVRTSERDAWKKELDKAEATADAKVRAMLEKEEGKPREADIKNRVMMFKDVESARKEVMECNIDLGMWEALKESYVQRSYMLKELVALYVAGYWGDSNSVQGSRSVRSSDADKARKSMSEQRQQLRRRSNG